jgi:hypothetical protein
VANVVKEILYNNNGYATRYIGRVVIDRGTHLWFDTGGTHVRLEKNHILRQSLNAQRRGN